MSDTMKPITGDVGPAEANAAALWQLAQDCGGVQVLINGAVPRLTFTPQTLEQFADAVASIALAGTAPDSYKPSPDELAMLHLRPDALQPAKVQQCTPASWTLVDDSGRPMVFPRDPLSEGDEAEPAILLDGFDCFTSVDQARAIADAILWDANGTNPRFADMEAKPFDSSQDSVL